MSCCSRPGDTWSAEVATVGWLNRVVFMLFSFVLGDAAFARPCQFHLKPENFTELWDPSLFIYFSWFNFIFVQTLSYITHNSKSFLGGKSDFWRLYTNLERVPLVFCA